MRVLVTWGSTHEGIAGIAAHIAATLAKHGHQVTCLAARDGASPEGFEAAVIGSAIYANRWHHDARHFVEHNLRELRRIPTWLFSSGPLDEGADRSAPTQELRALLARTGAVEHVAFGDRPDPAHIDAWAEALAHGLPNAKPRAYEELHGHALHRIIEYGAVAWAVQAAPLLAPSFVVAAILAVLAFGLLAHRYQTEIGAYGPLATAAVWAVFAAVLDAIFFRRLGVAIPVTFGFAAAWAVGAITAMTPVARPSDAG